MTGRRPVLVAPACSADEARALLQAGAGELYCGLMPDDWVHSYGDADLISRRQGRSAHVKDLAELRRIVAVAAEHEASVALALNARYSAAQRPRLIELLETWAGLGGTAVLLADLGLMCALAELRSGLELHVSLLAGVFNHEAAWLFADLGAARIVLPRDLTLSELAQVVEQGPPLGYESLACYQKCPFIDGMCLFYHGVRIPSDVPADFARTADPHGGPPLVCSLDPDYEGHGCRLTYQTPTGPVTGDRVGDATAPWCAACQARALAEAGVGYLKLAGRAYPTDQLVAAVGFLRRALAAHEEAGPSEARAAIQADYAATFGAACHGRRCYYRE